MTSYFLCLSLAVSLIGCGENDTAPQIIAENPTKSADFSHSFSEDENTI